MYNIGWAIVIVGFAFASIYAHIKTNGRCGEGWAFLAVLVLISGGCGSCP